MDCCALAATDPVALHRLDRVGPVEQVEVGDQPVGVCGDPHHPLTHVALEDGEVAAVAAAIGGDFLVGDDRAQARTPVDRRVADIRQAIALDDHIAFGLRDVGPRTTVVGLARARFELRDQLTDGAGSIGVGVVPRVEDLQEDPLRPPVVAGVGGADAAAAVVAEAETAQLPAVVVDVGLGGDGRMLSGLHRVLLGRQAERVEAHRVHHVVAGHPLVAAVDVGADEAQRMADVQTGAGRVREHVEHEDLLRTAGDLGGIGKRARRVGGLESSLRVPSVLPASLDLLRQRAGVPKLRGIILACRHRTHSPKILRDEAPLLRL